MSAGKTDFEHGRFLLEQLHRLFSVPKIRVKDTAVLACREHLRKESVRLQEENLQVRAMQSSKLLTTDLNMGTIPGQPH